MTMARQSDLFRNGNPIFDDAIIRTVNPEWEGKPGPIVPSFRRWAFPRLLRMLTKGLTPVVVLRGPRRIGKTILLRQIADQLRATGVAPTRILYLPFDELESFRRLDEPVLAVTHWFEGRILGRTFNEAARAGEPAFLFLDEVQNLSTWAPQIKYLVDNHTVRVLVTGSSSLRIESGRDSLAGRITSMDLGPLLLREIAGLTEGYDGTSVWPEQDLGRIKSLDYWRETSTRLQRTDADLRHRAFAAFSARGAYPIAHEHPETPWYQLASYLNETVIRRAIQHDLRMGERGRKRDEHLLEETFRLSCRYSGQAAGQAVFVPEIQQALAANIGWQRILTYLKFLDGTLLLRLIEPLELRLKRRKAPPKICLCDHSLRASWLQELVPLLPSELAQQPHLSDLAGHLAESVLGYYLATIPNVEVSWFPERGNEPEVDFVLVIGDQRIPIEVKYRRGIDPNRDTLGLRAFIEKTVYNAPFGLLITQEDGVTVNDPRIIPISLSALLWLR